MPVLRRCGRLLACRFVLRGLLAKRAISAMSLTAPTSLFRVHDADNCITVAEAFPHVAGIYDAVLVDGHGYHSVAISFELFRGVNDCMVLDFRYDYIARLVEGRCHTFDRHVVGLGTSAGKYHLAGATVQNRGDAGPRLVR